MDSKNTMNNEQHLQELQQRINAKAEHLVNYRKMLFKGTLQQVSAKRRWIAIAVLIALVVGLEVLCFTRNLFWEFNVWFGGFMILFFILYFLFTMVMRYFFTRMKNASTVAQYYRAVKQLIFTHKLRTFVPALLPLFCMDLVRYYGGFYSHSSLERLVICFACTVGVIWGSSMRNWGFDDEFCNDVKELGYLYDEMKNPD